MNKKRATTLLETLIAASLFLLALGIATSLAQTGIRSRQRGMDKNLEFRQAVTLFHQLEKDVRSSRRLYAPDPNTFDLRQPGLDSPPLILRIPQPQADDQVVAWYYQNQTLIRQFYRPDFHPMLSASQQPLVSERVHQSSSFSHFSLRFRPPGQAYGTPLMDLECGTRQPDGKPLLTTLEVPR